VLHNDAYKMSKCYVWRLSKVLIRGAGELWASFNSTKKQPTNGLIMA